MTRSDVLIVGAGPTGLVLALWLNKMGVSVRIIDKNP
jgi:2-polyprenyl-6-methoxyphenol hydroxylase-like FAD-dependent oxidoreductase